MVSSLKWTVTSEAFLASLRASSIVPALQPTLRTCLLIDSNLILVSIPNLWLLMFYWTKIDHPFSKISTIDQMSDTTRLNLTFWTWQVKISLLLLIMILQDTFRLRNLPPHTPLFLIPHSELNLMVEAKTSFLKLSLIKLCLFKELKNWYIISNLG